MRQFVAALAVAWCVGITAQDGKHADGIDIVFLIDDSRSMERNDPTDMRKVALKAFLDLTQETGGDRIAVLRFAGWETEGKPFLVYPLTLIPRDANKRMATLKAIKKAIEEKVTASGMATDFNYAFGVALTEAIRPWLKTNRPLWIVLFTDGQMAPGLLSLKQRLGKQFPAFYKPTEEAIIALKEAYEKARAGVGDFANLEFARKELKKRHLALRRKAEDLFGRLIARQAKTVFKDRKVVVSMVYLRSAAAKQQIRTPSDLRKSNAVADHLVQHLGAKLHLVGRRRLKSVFFDILKDVSDFWKPGLLRCYKDISVSLKPNEVRSIPIHIFQGATVTKVVIFGRSAAFEPRLLKDKQEVKMPQKSVFFRNGESQVEKKLFPHQKEAVNKLKAYYKDEGYKKELGWKPHILIMPTGAGKTFTANSFLYLGRILDNAHVGLFEIIYVISLMTICASEVSMIRIKKIRVHPVLIPSQQLRGRDPSSAGCRFFLFFQFRNDCINGRGVGVTADAGVIVFTV